MPVISVFAPGTRVRVRIVHLEPATDKEPEMEFVIEVVGIVKSFTTGDNGIVYQIKIISLNPRIKDTFCISSIHERFVSEEF